MQYRNLAIALAVVGMVGSGACTVDQRSDSYACDDGVCEDGRVCIDGWCVVAGSSDAGVAMDADMVADCSACGAGQSCSETCGGENDCNTTCNTACTCDLDCSEANNISRHHAYPIDRWNQINNGFFRREDLFEIIFYCNIFGKPRS